MSPLKALEEELRPIEKENLVRKVEEKVGEKAEETKERTEWSWESMCPKVGQFAIEQK